MMNGEEREARRELLDGLGKISLEALVLYLTRDESPAALAELVESPRWHSWMQWSC